MAATTVGFIGGGMMAEALIAGILKNNVAKASSISVFDVNNDRRKYLTEKFGVNVSGENKGVVEDSEVIILAVKPQVYQDCVASLSGLPKNTKDKLFVSIMGGVTVKDLHAGVGGYGDVVRVMPNTPAMVSAAASCYIVQKPLQNPNNDVRVKFTEKIFSAIGFCSEVPKESMLDAVTGLSGSGPAYAYMLVEAMSDAGVKKGLPRDLARKLAAQTVMGAGKMILETGEHPAVLRNNVESPGGTTIAGTSALEEGGFRNAVIKAVSAATERSVELGK